MRKVTQHTAVCCSQQVSCESHQGAVQPWGNLQLQAKPVGASESHPLPGHAQVRVCLDVTVCACCQCLLCSQEVCCMHACEGGCVLLWPLFVGKGIVISSQAVL